MQDYKVLPPNIKAVVGLVGKKNSGKDTVYEAMCHCWNARFIESRPVRFAFADLLKEEVAAKYGTTVEFINANKNEWRKILQEHGSARRLESPTYWIDRLHKQILSINYSHNQKKPYMIVLTDVRHMNEADYIRHLKGPLVKSLVRVYRKVADAVEDTHESEVNVTRIPIDAGINNDGSLLLLQNHVKFLLQDLRVH